MNKKVIEKLNSLISSLNNIILKRKKTSAATAGVATFFAYAPFSIWPIMFGSLIAISYILNNETKRLERFKIASVFFLAFNISNLNWVGKSFLYNAPYEWLVYVMPLAIIIMCIIITIPYAVIFYLLDLIRLPKDKKIYVLLATIILTEILRSFSVFGFPWNLVGYSIASNDYLLQICELWNIILCSFLIILISTLISTFDKKKVTIALSIFAAWFLIGGVRFLVLEHIKKPNALLLNTFQFQYDAKKHHNFDIEKMKKQVYFYLKALQNLPERSINVDQRLIVLPEMAIPYPVEDSAYLLNILASNLIKDDILVFGTPRYSNGEIYNSIYYMTQNQIFTYDKKLLVPFGEFMPFRSLLESIPNFTNSYQDFSSGTKNNIVEAGDQKMLSLVCYEVIFPFFVKNQINQTSKKNLTIINITNDAWFHGTVAPYQHALIAKTRSVENNVKMIRTANSGKSFIKQ